MIILNIHREISRMSYANPGLMIPDPRMLVVNSHFPWVLYRPIPLIQQTTCMTWVHRYILASIRLTHPKEHEKFGRYYYIFLLPSLKPTYCSTRKWMTGILASFLGCHLFRCLVSKMVDVHHSGKKKLPVFKLFQVCVH